MVGVPVGLITYVGWPLPTTLPTLDEIQLALRSGIDPQLLINTMAAELQMCGGYGLYTEAVFNLYPPRKLVLSEALKAPRILNPDERREAEKPKQTRGKAKPK